MKVNYFYGHKTSTIVPGSAPASKVHRLFAVGSVEEELYARRIG